MDRDMQNGLRLENVQRTTLHVSQRIRLAGMLGLNTTEIEEFIKKAAEDNPVLIIRQTEWKHNRNASVGETASLPMSLDGIANEDHSLSAFLNQQLLFLHVTEAQRMVVSYLIDALDDNGFLVERAEALSAQMQIPVDYIHQAISLLQGMDPPGVGAHDLQECLLLQLARDKKSGRLAQTILREHWDLFTQNPDAEYLAKYLQKPVWDIKIALTQIASLNPKPANGFSNAENGYLVPDAFVTKADGALEFVILSCSGVEIDPEYLALSTHVQDNEAKKFLLERFHQARTLQDALQYRQNVLHQILTMALQEQTDMFLHGTQKPLSKKDLAQKLGVHASTVVRAVKNKYYAYQNMVYPFESLFARANAADPTISTAAVKAHLKELIGQENKAAPYSDLQLSKLLAEKGIRVSGRVIAKYRQQEKIPSSYGRQTTDSKKGTPHNSTRRNRHECL